MRRSSKTATAPPRTADAQIDGFTRLEQSFEIPLPSPAKSVTLDPDGTLPARCHQ